MAMAASVSDRENGDDSEFNWSCYNKGRYRLFRNRSMSLGEGSRAELELFKLYNLK